MKKLIFAAIFAVASSSALASACENLPEYQMIECADEEEKQAVEELTKVYWEIIRDADDAYAAHFLKTARLWREYIEHECSPPHGAVSVGGLAYIKMCQNAAIKERVRELRARRN